MTAGRPARVVRAAWTGLIAVVVALLAGLFATAAGAEPAITFQNKWQNTYLAAGPSGPVLANDANTPEAQWLMESIQDADGTFMRFRSAATGGYLHIENGPLAVGPAEPNRYSAMWAMVPMNDGSIRLQNRWQPDIYINTENGGVEAGQIEPGWLSANWAREIVAEAAVAGGPAPMPQPVPDGAASGAGGFPRAGGGFRTVQDTTGAQLAPNQGNGGFPAPGPNVAQDGMAVQADPQAGTGGFPTPEQSPAEPPVQVAGGEPTVTLQNKWRNTFLAVGPGGPVLADQPDAPEARWILERLADQEGTFFRVKSAGTGGYLNIEQGPLAVGPVEPNWYSAMWQLVRAPTDDGSIRLQNRWQPDIIVNTENGGAEAGRIMPDWTSANWALEVQAGAAVAGGFPKGQDGQGGLDQGRAPVGVAPGTAEITIANFQYPRVDVFHYDQQDNRTLFAKVANGQTVQQAATAGGRLRFAAEGKWLGDVYTIDQQPAQTILFQDGRIVLNGNAAAPAGPVATEEPEHPPGTVPVVVASNSGAAMRLAEMPKTPDGTPRGVADLDPGATTTVWLTPGMELGAYDLGTRELAGQTYIVTAAPQGQSIAVPYIRPGSVRVSMRNSTASELSCQEVPENGGAAIPLFSIAPGSVVSKYFQPGKRLGFIASNNPSEWLGGAYQVTAAAEQSITLPISAGDLDGNGTVSDAEMKQIAMKVAVAVVQKIRENENQAETCWKNSYGRGVGKIPTSCNGNTENNAGLCYTQCKPGYTSFVTMCVPDCPPGFRNDGLYCFKPSPVSRSAFKWEIGDTLFSLDDARARCAKSADGRRYGCVTANSNTIVYSNCPAGFKTAPLITSLCTPVCPPGMTDIGISCQKNTYDRGVGRIPDCGGGTPDKDAGLCYKNCSGGYNGVGPVCWGSCPAGWVDCGAMCGARKGACAAAIAYQTSSVGMVALNVGLVAATAGGAAGATAAATAAKTAAQTAGKAAAKAAARETARAALKAQVKAALASKGGAALAAIGKDLALDSLINTAFAVTVPAYQTLSTNRQMRDAVKENVAGILAGDVTDDQIDAVVGTAMENANARTGYADNFDYTMLDPTGVADVVMQFNLPMCATIR